jgi:hypothetical protein
LRHAGPAISLLVEIDVIEPILPAHGNFIVKLAKRGNNLGIQCRSEMKGAKGEPVVISDIKMGSAAHRCGSIQIGDRIKAIDDIPLDNCSVEEAMRLLQRAGTVVKLAVCKGNVDEAVSELGICAKMILVVSEKRALFTGKPIPTV